MRSDGLIRIFRFEKAELVVCFIFLHGIKGGESQGDAHICIGNYLDYKVPKNKILGNNGENTIVYSKFLAIYRRVRRW
ncbi:hypothetical protein OUZ56_019918 [Daphnia magna]|uniref:Uncharacterized protein n=1 Tax=Daphnia magna TaxID=35525 RepID=A0ABQ9ZD02_9CRUS|nr:hypothetical protein OUZ56_019918 [Daphnia magna]